MDAALYYIRDNLVGTHYFIYAFILYFFMFSIIGYLFKQKYGKLDIKLATSQSSMKNKVEETSTKKERKKVKKNKVEIETTNKTTDVSNSPSNEIQSNSVVDANKVQANPNAIINPTPQPNTKPLEVPNPEVIPNPATTPQVPPQTMNEPIPEIKL